MKLIVSELFPNCFYLFIALLYKYEVFIHSVLAVSDSNTNYLLLRNLVHHFGCMMVFYNMSNLRIVPEFMTVYWCNAAMVP